MKVLTLCSGNHGNISPFVEEQVQSIRKKQIQNEIFAIKGKGPLGYLKNYPSLLSTIKRYKPDLIHAHFRDSALLASLQFKTKIIATFHGNDINPIQSIGKLVHKKIPMLSKYVIKRSSYTIFVSNQLAESSNIKRNYGIIPCGVDLNNFQHVDKELSRKRLGLNCDCNYILFSSSFDRVEKNSKLAFDATKQFKETLLLEFKNYSRDESNLLINAADVLLLTSINEGSPQVIKEAMACGTPIVSTDVGDVRQVIEEVDGCFLTTFKVEEVIYSLKEALFFSKMKKKTNGRERILELGLSLENTAEKIINIYKSLV